MDLPSESREKSSQKNQAKSPCAGAPNICTVAQAYHRKSRDESPAFARPLGCFLSNRNSQTIVYRRLPASELSPSPREKLACQPMGGRAQSSSGNWSCTPVTPPPKPLPIGHKTCARAVPRLAREIRSLLLCLSPLLVPPPLLGWLRRAGISRPLGSLRRTVTAVWPCVLLHCAADRKTGVMQGPRSECSLSMGMRLISSTWPGMFFTHSCTP